MASWITERPTAVVLDRTSAEPWWLVEPLSSLVQTLRLQDAGDTLAQIAREPAPCGLVLETDRWDELPPIIDAAHRQRVDLPVLVVARNATLQDSADVFRMGASFLPSPDSPRLLARDVALFLSRRMLPEDRRRVALRPFCTKHGISQRKAEIVALVAVGFGRKELAWEMGLSENSVKSHVREIIRRTDSTNLECLLAKLDDYAAEHITRLVGRRRNATGRHRLQSQIGPRGEDLDASRDSSEWNL